MPIILVSLKLMISLLILRQVNLDSLIVNLVQPIKVGLVLLWVWFSIFCLDDEDAEDLEGLTGEERTGKFSLLNVNWF